MFNIFKRKTREPPIVELPLPKCIHTWKDFPWYMVANWTINNARGTYGDLDLTIFEPYVCIHCHERKDIKLMEIHKLNISKEECDRRIEDFYDHYKDHMKSIPIVEDMIHDYIFVDREKLEIAEKITGRNSNE